MTDRELKLALKARRMLDASEGDVNAVIAVLDELLEGYRTIEEGDKEAGL